MLLIIHLYIKSDMNPQRTSVGLSIPQPYALAIQDEPAVTTAGHHQMFNWKSLLSLSTIHRDSTISERNPYNMPP